MMTRCFEMNENAVFLCYTKSMMVMRNGSHEGLGGTISSEESPPFDTQPTTNEYAAVDYPAYFQDWQVDCCEKIKNQPNVILSAPTGSGKTSVFMQWAKEKRKQAEEQGELNHKVYITAPIKALSNQRFRELQEAGYKVGLETGDIKNVSDEADFICCTQEIYTNKYAENENATLIVDEFHYMFENPSRQRAYIDGLHKAKAKNVLTCSATMGDMEKTVNYVNKVSDRDFVSYETQDRLTDLSYEGKIDRDKIDNALVVAFSVNKILGITEQLCDERRNAGKQQLGEEKEEQERTRKEAEIKEVAKKYQTTPQSGMAYGVANYYGRMLPKEKLFVEELFERELIDTVVGTDALAMGVNFPIENVVFTQLMKYKGKYNGSERLSKNLFDQLCGRAGRKGYFDEGHVYYCSDFTDINGYPTEERYRNWVNDDWWEWERYDTGEILEDLKESENESIAISLDVDMRSLLSGKRSLEDEIKYIADFSTEYSEADLANLQEKIKDGLDYIFGYSVDADYPEYDDEFFEGIAQAYDETVPANEERELYEKNCRLFARVILDSHNKENDEQKISTRDLFLLYVEHPDNFNELLLFRKYMHGLPRKYRKMYDLAGLDNVINRTDFTALNAGSGQLRTSDLDVAKYSNIDVGLLTTLYDFDDVEDELFEAIRGGRIPAEKVFNQLRAKKQWDVAEVFKKEFGVDVDVTSIISKMYDEAREARYGTNLVHDVDFLVKKNLIEIFKLGGDLGVIADKGGSLSPWRNGDLRRDNTIENAIEHAGFSDFEKNFAYIKQSGARREVILKKIFEIYNDWGGIYEGVNDDWEIWEYAKNELKNPENPPEKMLSALKTISLRNLMKDEEIWGYVINKLGGENREKLFSYVLVEDGETTGSGAIANLLDRGMTKNEVLGVMSNDQAVQTDIEYGGFRSTLNELIKLGFSPEKIYERLIDINNNDFVYYEEENPEQEKILPVLLDNGLPAQRIIDDTQNLRFLLMQSDYLIEAGGDISPDKVMGLVQNAGGLLNELLSIYGMAGLLEKLTEFGVNPKDVAKYFDDEQKMENGEILEEYGINLKEEKENVS